MRLIQGFFVQLQRLTGIGSDVELGDVAVMRKALLPFMYSGSIYQEAGILVGDMIDDQGPSRLFDIMIDEDGIRFTKQYLHHELLGARSYIFYTFRVREENTWVGTWKYQRSEGAIWGPTRCIITEVNEALLHGDIAAYASEKRGEFSSEAVDRYVKKHGR